MLRMTIRAPECLVVITSPSVVEVRYPPRYPALRTRRNVELCHQVHGAHCFPPAASIVLSTSSSVWLKLGAKYGARIPRSQSFATNPRRSSSDFHRIAGDVGWPMTS